jgi:hypothetical protein
LSEKIPDALVGGEYHILANANMNCYWTSPLLFPNGIADGGLTPSTTKTHPRLLPLKDNPRQQNRPPIVPPQYSISNYKTMIQQQEIMTTILHHQLDLQ